MNILYEQFPEEVKVNGEYYPIVTDFREWIRFTELVEDDSVPWRMKCGLLLQWYLDQVPEDIEAAIYALGDFLMCKRMYQDDLEDEEEEQQKSGKPVFSFSEDAGCIYAAFREAYGIDLQQMGVNEVSTTGYKLTAYSVKKGMCYSQGNMLIIGKWK